MDKLFFIYRFLAIPRILHFKKLSCTKHNHAKVFVPEALELSSSYV